MVVIQNILILKFKEFKKTKQNKTKQEPKQEPNKTNPTSSSFALLPPGGVADIVGP